MSSSTPMLNPQPQLPGFRYWPYERMSWRQTVAKSGLPDDVQKLITGVIKQSRLMRFEKVEVVDELIAHFVDGKTAGRSYAQLIANFGDVTTTASLIRNSKIRNRPIMFKIAQIMGWGVLAVASAYLGLWGYFQSGHPSPTNDFMPTFNQFAEDVADDDLAWPIYRPAFTKFGFCEGGEFNRKMQIFYVAMDEDDSFGNPQTRRITPDDNDWPLAVARLDELQELLDAFRAAAHKPRMGLKLQVRESNYSPEDYAALYPDSEEIYDRTNTREKEDLDPASSALIDDSIVSILLPHVQSFRTAARLLHFDNLYAVEQNDSERVTDNLIAHFSLASHAADCNCLVGSLVGFAVAGMGFEEIEAMLAERDFLSEDQLARIQNALEEFNLRDLVRFEGERAMMHDIIQRVFTDDGDGDGRITPAGMKILQTAMGMRNEKWSKSYPEFESVVDVAQKLSEPLALFVSPSRKETLQRYDAILDLIKEDVDRPAWTAEINEFPTMASRGIPQYSPLYYFLPANRQIQDRLYFTIGLQEATIAALAIHRFHLKHNRWPQTIEQLAPEFVTEIPVDVFDGNHLRYVVRDDSPVIYSVWKDGDDDGLKEATYAYFDSKTKQYYPVRTLDDHQYYIYRKHEQGKYDGDIVLWPTPQQ